MSAATRYRVAAIFAHPDDDTFGLAGTYLLFGDRMEMTLVVATSGEAGLIAHPALATRDDLADVREREEREALRRAGMGHADVRWLRHPDGDLEGVPRERLVADVAAMLREKRPQVVFTFGPEGVTKHPDHVRIGEVATEAFHLARQGSAEGTSAFQRLLYSSWPRTELDRFYDELRKRGMPDVDPEAPYMPRGVPDESIAVAVDCRSVVEGKLEALRAHATQAEELELTPPDLQKTALGTEWFVQAWPPVAPGARRPSPFDGLEPGTAS